MLFGELRPLVRPLSRRLAAAGWVCAAVGMITGLVVAVSSGVRLSVTMHFIQGTGVGATVAAVVLLSLAALLQPPAILGGEGPELDSGRVNFDDGRSTTGHGTLADDGGRTPAEDASDSYYSSTGTHVRSFLLGSMAMLLGVVGFALAGWLLPGGPSARSGAFSQIFLLGAASCGLTFLLLHKAAPRGHRDAPRADPRCQGTPTS